MIKQKANMIFSRRSFIASLTGAAVMPKSLFSSITPTFDESSAIFLADTHISGEGGKKMLNFLRSTIAEILRMQPLPRHVFLLGDVAYNVGKESDYKRAFSELKLLSDAGIKLTIGMGNHDHRKAFLEYWPEYKTRSLVEGEILTATSLPHYDIIMLDSLNETGEIGKLNVDTGAISKKSQEWILENLPKWPRPFFIAAHHPIAQTSFSGVMGGLKTELHKFPFCKGLINGHTHTWLANYLSLENKKNMPSLSLPSTGYWGDIGYATIKTQEWHGRKAAVATLFQKDFILLNQHPGKNHSIFRNIRIKGNKGAKCPFVI